GEATALTPDDRVMIVPSIAGGRAGSPLRPVDHAALRTNQAVIIGLLIAAYIADAPVVVAAVGLLMLIGAARTRPAFGWFYSWLRRPGWLKPDVVSDNPEPHRFAQLLGGIFLSLSALGFAVGWPGAGSGGPAPVGFLRPWWLCWRQSTCSPACASAALSTTGWRACTSPASRNLLRPAPCREDGRQRD
ncbi:MAG: putative rane protein, partial [Anaerolineales bacterium]|nr:putative rane protein [Anaerolineales bacterium]